MSEPHIFNGPEYVPERDNKPLLNQIQRIYMVMEPGQWSTLEEIAAMTGDPAASISAQLRHLRKPRFGSFEVQRRARGGRLYEYRLVVKDAGSTAPTSKGGSPAEAVGCGIQATHP